MKTNEPRDDEILGRALSRAIETLDVEQTPYERARITVRPLRRSVPVWRAAALATSVVLAIALGSWLGRPTSTNEPAAVPSSATPVATNSPAATVTPTPIASPQAALDHERIYFARPDLGPIGVHSDAVVTAGGPDKRIARRLAYLLIEDRPSLALPAGAIDARPPRGIVTAITGVAISGDLVTVDVALPSDTWNIATEAAALALRQQIVYTGTEEPGVRALLITQNGGRPTRIGPLAWDQPLTRENVSGYARVDPQFMSEGWPLGCFPQPLPFVQSPCPSPSTARLSSAYSVDSVAPGVTRFVIGIESGQPASLSIDPRQPNETTSPLSGKRVLGIDVVGGIEGRTGTEIVDRTPLRSVRSSVNGSTTSYELGLDDLRPWRVLFLSGPDRIVIDLGGYPASTSGTVAVYAPSRGGTVGRQFTLSGLSRTFEATTGWRVRDATQRIVASGVTTASRGTSQLWGTFQVDVQLPASITGNVTLEVYWASPKDGSDQGLVRVPLTVR